MTAPWPRLIASGADFVVVAMKRSSFSTIARALGPGGVTRIFGEVGKVSEIMLAPPRFTKFVMAAGVLRVWCQFPARKSGALGAPALQKVKRPPSSPRGGLRPGLDRRLDRRRRRPS